MRLKFERGMGKGSAQRLKIGKTMWTRVCSSPEEMDGVAKEALCTAGELFKSKGSALEIE